MGFFIPALIAGAAAIGGAALASSASRSAANTQAASTNAALAEQARQFDATMAMLREQQAQAQSQYQWMKQATQPARRVDKTANWALSYALGLERAPPTGNIPGFDPSGIHEALRFGKLIEPYEPDLTNDPGYLFRMGRAEEMAQRIGRNAGSMFGGNAMKAATDYVGQSASDEYQRAWDRGRTRRMDLANLLFTASGRGAVPAGVTQAGANALAPYGNMAAAGQGYGNTIADLLTAQGNANAAGIIGSGNAWARGVTDIGTILAGMYGRGQSGGGNVYNSPYIP
jgi:hypothetical protein